MAQSPPSPSRIEIGGVPVRRLVRVRLDRAGLVASLHARLDRADEHLQELQRDIGSVGEGDRIRIGSKFNAQRTMREVDIYYRRPDPRLRWSTIVSDFAHELRAALDNAVYAVAFANAAALPLPARVEKILAFPIADADRVWDGPHGSRLIASLPEDVIALVSAAQPCHGGDPILSMLGGLNNVDKHKAPVIVDGLIGQWELAGLFRAAKGRILNILALDGPRLTDAPLLRVLYEEAQPPDEGELEYSVRFGVFIAQGDRPVPVVDAMQGMRGEVARLIDLLEPFITGVQKALPPGDATGS